MAIFRFQKNNWEKNKTKKIKSNDDINIKINSIENSISNLNNLVYDKDKKIFALKRELKEVKEKENKIINKLFKVIDNMDEIRLGLKRTNQREMLEIINRSLKVQRDDLREMGIEEIPTIGEKFNSNIHECIQTVRVEGVDKGEIVEVVKRGYYFKGEIIRTAIVVTGQ